MPGPRRIVRYWSPDGWRLRNATPEEISRNDPFDGEFVEETPDIQAAASQQAEQERLTRGANAPGVALAVGASQAASVATFGASSALGLDVRSGLSDNEREVLRRENQGAEAIGSVVGALLPFGAEGLAARAAANLTRGAGWTARVAATAAEGAFGGLGAAASEAGIAGDTAVFGERAVANMGIGALIGLGTGGLMSVPSGVRRALGRRSGIVRQTIDEAADVAVSPSTLREAIEASDANMLHAVGRDPETLLERGRAAVAHNPHNVQGIDVTNPAVSRAARAWEDNAERNIGQWVRRADAAVHEADAALRQLDDVSSISGEVSDGFASRLFAHLDEGSVRVLNDMQGLSSAERSLQQRALGTYDEGMLAFSEASPADRIGIINGVRRDLRDIVDSVDGEPSALTQSIRGMHDEMIDAGGLTLGNESSLGLGQWSQQQNLSRNIRRARDRAVQRVRGGSVDGNMLDARAISRREAERMFREPSTGGTIDGVKNWAAMLDALEEASAVTGSKFHGQALRRDMKEAVVNGTAFHAERRGLAADAMSGGAAAAGRQALGGVGLLAGASGAAGFIAGGPVIGAAAAAGTAALGAFFRSPVGMSRMVNRLRDSMGRQSTRVARATMATKRALRTGTATRLSPAAGTLGALYLNGSEDDKRAAFDVITKQLDQMDADPMLGPKSADSEFGVHIEGTGGGMAKAAGQMARVVGALQGARRRSRRSRAGAFRVSALDLPPLPSMSEVEGLLQVASVVEDPVFGVDLMNAGRLSEQSAAGLADAYPEFHTEMTIEFMVSIANMLADGQRPDYHHLLHVSRFARMPLDRTMSPEFNAVMVDKSSQTTEQEAALSNRPISVRQPSFVSNEATTTDRYQ